MNRRERRAGRSRGDVRNEIPPGYAEQIDDMAKLIVRWFAEHPGSVPIFFMPPPEWLLVVELSLIKERIAGNRDAFELVQQIIDAAPTAEKTPTLFMLRVALGHIGLPTLIKPVGHFTKGGRLVPMQRGGQA